MPRPAPRIARSVPLGRRKPSGRSNPRHRAFINSLPCVACGRAAPSECAHVRMGTDGGTGYKPADRFCLPLCEGCHRTGPAAQHTIGEPAFWAERGVDPVDIAARLYAVTGDTDQGLRTISRARQAIALHQRTTK